MVLLFFTFKPWRPLTWAFKAYSCFLFRNHLKPNPYWSKWDSRFVLVSLYFLLLFLTKDLFPFYFNSLALSLFLLFACFVKVFLLLWQSRAETSSPIRQKRQIETEKGNLTTLTERERERRDFVKGKVKQLPEG